MQHGKNMLAVAGSIAVGFFVTFFSLMGNAAKDPSPRESSGVIQRPVQQAVVREAPRPKKEATTYRVKKVLRLSKQEFECLARNVFHEAGVEGFVGMVAVAQVTMNRVESGEWGKKVCDVVYSKAQFSWTLYKSKKYSVPKGKLWDESVEAVKAYLSGHRVRGLAQSVYYHTDYVAPKWASSMKVAVQIGRHIFYNA
jgi:N-acetylmuramoyl-L-alanine amidase